VLVRNLLAAVGHGERVAFAPQADFLKLLMCGDGTALGFRFGLAFRGPWVWALKDMIDTGFMRLFAPESLPDLTAAAASSGGGLGGPSRPPPRVSVRYSGTRPLRKQKQGPLPVFLAFS